MAALVLVVTLGSWLKSNEERSGRAASTDDTSAFPVVSPSPTLGAVALLEGPLDVGWHTVVAEGVPISFRLPAPGWENHGNTYISKSSVGPQDAEAIIFWTRVWKGEHARACGQWWGAPDASLARIAINASVARGVELVTGPSDVTVGGQSGKHVVFTVRKDVACNPGFFHRWQDDRGGAFWSGIEIGDTIRVWLVGAGQEPLYIEGDSHERAGPDLEREIQQIVGSIRFGGGSVGIPPEEATPSTPERGELVLSFYGSAEGIPRTKIYVYADGRLIWQQEGDLPEGANASTTGFLEQRLTPEGVEMMRAEIASSGLFGDELDLVPHGPLDATPGSALERLVPRIVDPASWLPAAAWKDREVSTYVPSRYEVCYEGTTRDSERVLAQLPPSAPSIRDRNRCSEVTTADARAIVARLEDAGLEQIEPKDASRLEYQLEFGGFSMWFEPFLPHGKITPQTG
ncbi:MAG: hypothetical protein OEV60_01350 [Actinomycetota bacterium]|nr:hypothetical protein [Actinomycetota bacterium]MDH5223171.1 hypothetical protein [Actinomycetota bacterium]MDH5312223.1 hypothetical protein [Actinomycetota bacterium]